jgi:putative transposase
MMPIRSELIELFEPEMNYHIVCKAIAGKLLFHSGENKAFFLRRYKDLVAPFLETLAYHLLDNHVHLIVKTLPIATITAVLQELPKDSITKTQRRFLASVQKDLLYHELIEQQFNRLFISYVRALHIQLKTSGHLFCRPFKRIAIKSEAHLQQAIIYVHANEQKHGLRKDFAESPYSSYRAILTQQDGIVASKYVIDFFGSKAAYYQIHKEQVAWFYSRGWPSSKLE